MEKQTATSRKSRRRKTKRTPTIDEARASLDRAELANPRAREVIALLRLWLNDDSGYDERTWPKLKKALNDTRDRVGARRLFDD